MTLHIEDTGGTGRPVILIHGWPLSAAAWAHQIAPLRDSGLRVITYDRRGFGQSDKPDSGYDYDTLAADLHGIMTDHDLRDASLVGFSMGGGEVARYILNHGQDWLKSIVFASAVPPYLLQTDDNPDGPLTQEKADEFEKNLKADRAAFFDQFTKDFFSVDGTLKVSEDERKKALALCKQSSQTAALATMKSWATTDFRDDLGKITVPTLVLHGTGDGVVPIEGSGERTHKAVAGSKLHKIDGAPHGCNVSHADEFNRALVAFLTE